VPIACKLCIAIYGLRGTDIDKLPKTEAEFYEHLEQAHGLHVVTPDGRPWRESLKPQTPAREVPHAGV